MERFLDRLNRSSIRDEVLEALRVQEGDGAITESAASEQIGHRAPVQEATSGTLDVDHGNFLLNNADLVNGLHERVYAPLQIVSANIEHSGASQCFDSSKMMGNSSVFYSGDWNMSHDRQRLASYFGMRASYYAWILRLIMYRYENT